MGEFMLGAFMAQLYINIEKRPVSDRENLIGTVVFFAAAVSVIVITYLNYANLNDGPDVGANIVPQDEYEFRFGAHCGVAGFLRCPLQKLWDRGC